MNKRFIVGTLFPKLRIVRRLAQYAELVEFLKVNPARDFADRASLYRFVCATVAADGPLDMIELGVWRGASLELWLDAHRHPAGRFFGLDTFEGLPEVWQHVIGSSPRGTFSADGQTPAPSDPRVAFRKGLIQDELPSLLRGETLGAKPLVVHFDADLYSATLFALATLDTLLAPRVSSYVAVFDEFSSANDEFRAFSDYTRAFLRRFRVLGRVGKSYDQAAIEVFFTPADRAHM
jgi:hypothetical protein